MEDFTGKGLEDLKNGYIRTPLEPFETFWQDPLRVMRCIRFAARFQFTIAEEAKQAILDPRIKQVLKTKISKERIGAELDKMIDDGAGRSTALGLIQELGLYDVVFAPPEINDVAKGTTSVQGESRSTEEAFKLVWIMEWLLKINHSSAGEEYDSIVYQGQIDEGQEKMLRQTQGLPWTNHLYPAIKTDIAHEIPHIPQMTAKEEPFPEKLGKRNLILAGMLYPYRDMSATVNKKIVPAGSWILRYGLKGRNLDIEIVTKLTESIKNVQEVVDKTALTIPEDEEALREERASMGVVIRDIGFITVVGKKWPCAFLLALGVDLIPKFDQLKQGVMGMCAFFFLFFLSSCVYTVMWGTIDRGEVVVSVWGMIEKDKKNAGVGFLLTCTSVQSSIFDSLDEDVRAKIEKYNTFLRKAETYDIDHCFSWKYIVDVSCLAAYSQTTTYYWTAKKQAHG